MSLERRCDVCGVEAMFQVGWWEDGRADRLMDTSDVCGTKHARDVIADWQRLIRDAEKEAAG